MGKQSGKMKKQEGGKLGDSNEKQSKSVENSPKAHDKDTATFVAMSREFKEAGNKSFQVRDYESAMSKYDKAINLLPRNHIDVSHLRSNLAACYMQMGVSEYPRAIHECNLALEVTPNNSKALLKRARCYEAMNRLDLALRDVSTVLKMEPNNFMASEIAERVKTLIEKRGKGMSTNLVPIPESIETPSASPPAKVLKEKQGKKNKAIEENQVKDKTEEKKTDNKIVGKKAENKVGKKRAKGRVHEKKGEDKLVRKKIDKVDKKKAEDKVVVEDKESNNVEKGPKRSVKLVFSEDIRWAQIPVDCSMLKLREIIHDRFPSSKAVLVKYRDQEGDLITITTTEELRWAEASVESNVSMKLYIIEVSPEQDPFFDKVKREVEVHKFDSKQLSISENGDVGKTKETQTQSCLDDWIIEFAQLFKNYVGFNSDAYLDLHELGMKLYSEAMEETVTSEEAQELFDAAANEFQEMAALALFNWGNVHMSRARKRVYMTEDGSAESVLAKVEAAYDWAQKEYSEAAKRYEEALKIKPDFYEVVLALGQQRFERAKLSWYHALGTPVDLETWDPAEVLNLYNNAEDNMERGMLMWEEAEERRLNELSSPNKAKSIVQKMGLEGFIKDISTDEAAEQSAIIRSQINILWGTLLYERSLMEFKIGIPVWHECLEVAVEKFELAGASATDIAVMLKNHCSNGTAPEGLVFNIDEIVQAWNEMHEAKRWHTGLPCFRLEPLLRRRDSKLYLALGHA